MAEELSDEKIRILLALYDNMMEGLTIEEIAVRVGIEKNKLKKLLKELEAESYIEERIFPDRVDFDIENKGLRLCEHILEEIKNKTRKQT